MSENPQGHDRSENLSPAELRLLRLAEAGALAGVDLDPEASLAEARRQIAAQKPHLVPAAHSTRDQDDQPFWDSQLPAVIPAFAAASSRSAHLRSTTPITPGSSSTGAAGSYPVVDSAALNPVRRRLFRRARRELSDIPKQPPGTALVFQLGDTYEAYKVPRDGSLRLDDEIVVRAVGVAVVSLRHELREVVAYLPTLDPSTHVALHARFHCWVTDPQLVLDAGCWDIDPVLSDHLIADRRLRFMTQGIDPRTQWQMYLPNATARLFAYHDMHPLIVPGLRAELVDIAVEQQRSTVASEIRDERPGGPVRRL